MLTDYIQAAMQQAVYEQLDDDGSIYAEIPVCQGVWANEATHEQCREELRSVLEGWILLGIYHHHSLPIVNGIDINPTLALEVA
jgi:predicted RNase H-like HicB family nuclease